MRVGVVTLFPRMFEGPLTESIVQRARDKGILELAFCDPRDFSEDRHRTVDDRPYGGGPGMVLMAEPLYRAVKKVRRRGSTVVMMSPQGRPFDQAAARRLSAAKDLVLVCGHYEGVDERVMDFVDEELSLGDFVMTGGEIAAMSVIDAVTRLLPGVLVKEGAAEAESFTGPSLDHPHYTRPRVWRGRAVPEVLCGGDHAAIAAWRRKAAKAATRKKRPDLL
ncbi:MAG: tRNA (guanosine(37)-N1)-methyltransferase TrmD [Elusimicrobia bacterium]|nr:tRNA (guanosine(37)-N1)-methyltransferase TrmD [Elusimicrobiota bacterium]